MNKILADLEFNTIINEAHAQSQTGTELLNKYKVDCFNYKVWSSETIQNWSKLQEWLKSGNNSNCSTKKKSMILKKIE